MFMKLFSLCFCLFCCYYCSSAQTIYQDISGQNVPIGTIVNWTTIEEIDVATFVIEKSNNGVQYLPVYECAALKETGNMPTNYSFLDIKTNSPIAHYRIKEILDDGTYSYSEVLKVSQNFQNNLLIEQVSDISNTKENGILSVYYSSLIAGALIYSIENEEQRILSEGEETVFAGPNLLAVDFSLFPQGTYTLKMEMGKEVELILFKKLDEQLNFEVNSNVPRNYSVKNQEE